MNVLRTRHFFSGFYVIFDYQARIKAGYEVLIRDSESKTSGFIIVVHKNLQERGMEGIIVDAISCYNRYCKVIM